VPAQCIYIFCLDLKTNSDCFHTAFKDNFQVEPRCVYSAVRTASSNKLQNNFVFKVLKENVVVFCILGSFLSNNQILRLQRVNVAIIIETKFTVHTVSYSPSSVNVSQTVEQVEIEADRGDT